MPSSIFDIRNRLANAPRAEEPKREGKIFEIGQRLKDESKTAKPPEPEAQVPGGDLSRLNRLNAVDPERASGIKLILDDPYIPEGSKNLAREGLGVLYRKAIVGGKPRLDDEGLITQLDQEIEAARRQPTRIGAARSIPRAFGRAGLQAGAAVAGGVPQAAGAVLKAFGAEEAGEGLQGFGENMGAAYQELAQEPDVIQSRAAEQPWTAEWAANLAGQGGHSLALSMVPAGVAGNIFPALSNTSKFMLFAAPNSAVAFGGAFEQAKKKAVENGDDEEMADAKALAIGGGAAMAETLSELIPWNVFGRQFAGDVGAATIRQIVRRGVAKNLAATAGRGLAGAGAEGAEEVVSALAQDVLNELVNDSKMKQAFSPDLPPEERERAWNQFVAELRDSFVGGALAGGPVAGTAYGGSVLEIKRRRAERVKAREESRQDRSLSLQALREPRAAIPPPGTRSDSLPPEIASSLAAQAEAEARARIASHMLQLDAPTPDVEGANYNTAANLQAIGRQFGPEVAAEVEAQLRTGQMSQSQLNLIVNSADPRVREWVEDILRAAEVSAMVTADQSAEMGPGPRGGEGFGIQPPLQQTQAELGRRSQGSGVNPSAVGAAAMEYLTHPDVDDPLLFADMLDEEAKGGQSQDPAFDFAVAKEIRRQVDIMTRPAGAPRPAIDPAGDKAKIQAIAQSGTTEALGPVVAPLPSPAPEAVPAAAPAASLAPPAAQAEPGPQSPARGERARMLARNMEVKAGEDYLDRPMRYVDVSGGYRVEHNDETGWIDFYKADRPADFDALTGEGNPKLYRELQAATWKLAEAAEAEGRQWQYGPTEPQRKRIYQQMMERGDLPRGEFAKQQYPAKPEEFTRDDLARLQKEYQQLKEAGTDPERLEQLRAKGMAVNQYLQELKAKSEAEKKPAESEPKAKKSRASEERERMKAKKQPKPELVDTIVGKISLAEFEREGGYTPEEVTKKDWVNLQRAERGRLGQQEGGDSPNAPWAEYEEFHRQAVKDALARGEKLDARVLADYSDLVRYKAPAQAGDSGLPPASDTVVDTYATMPLENLRKFAEMGIKKAQETLKKREVAEAKRQKKAAEQSRPERKKPAAMAQPREMNVDGRAKDGQPINPGNIFKTSSGRVTTPFPKQKNRKYASQWLIDNAVAEAQARGDDFNVTGFGGETLLKNGELPPASKDSMLEYLFGQQPPVVKSIFKTPQTQAPAPEAPATPAPVAQPQPPAPKSIFEKMLDTLSPEERAEMEALEKEVGKAIGRANAGIDPTILIPGVKLTNLYMKAGARSFIQYARMISERLGKNIRPYLKMLYSAARYSEGSEAFRAELTAPDAVDKMSDADIDALLAGAPETAPVEKAKVEEEKTAAAPTLEEIAMMSPDQWDAARSSMVPPFVEAADGYISSHEGQMAAYKKGKSKWPGSLKDFENQDKSVPTLGRTYQDTVDLAKKWREENPVLAMGHESAIEAAIEKRLPVSAAAADAYGIKQAKGYVREGGRYVFSEPSAKPAEPAVAPLATLQSSGNAKDDADRAYKMLEGVFLSRENGLNPRPLYLFYRGNELAITYGQKPGDGWELAGGNSIPTTNIGLSRKWLADALKLVGFSKKPAPATEVAKVVEPPPAMERKAEAAGDGSKKQLKIQKTFLLEALDKLIAEAPEGQSKKPNEDQEQRLSTARNAVIKAEQDVKQHKYSKSCKEELKTAKERLRQVTAKVLGEINGKVAIEIPGDGQFMLVNEKGVLEQFKKVAKSQFPLSSDEPLPNLPSLGGSINPPKVPKGQVKEQEIREILKVAVSHDDSRAASLKSVHFNPDKNQYVAADGRRLFLVEAERGEKWSGKAVEGYPPNYEYPIPRELDNSVEVDAAKAFQVIASANLVHDSESSLSNATSILVGTDGELAAVAAGKVDTLEKTSTKNAVTTDANYESENALGSELRIGDVDGKLLLDGIAGLMKLGNDRISISWKDDFKIPILLTGNKTGDRAKYILMSMRDKVVKPGIARPSMLPTAPKVQGQAPQPAANKPANPPSSTDRTSPRKGTKERDELDAKYKKMEEALSALYSEEIDLKEKVGAAKYGSEKKTALEKKLEKSRARQRESLEAFEPIRKAYRQAELEDYVETGSAIQKAWALQKLGRKSYEESMADVAAALEEYGREQGATEEEIAEMQRESRTDTMLYRDNEPKILLAIVRGNKLKADAKAKIEAMPMEDDAKFRQLEALRNASIWPESIEEVVKRAEETSGKYAEGKRQEEAAKAELKRADEKRRAMVADEVGALSEEAREEWRVREGYLAFGGNYRSELFSTKKQAEERLAGATDKERAEVVRRGPHWQIVPTREAMAKFIERYKSKEEPKKPTEAFDKLFATVKTREGEGGKVTLYGDVNDNNAEGDYDELAGIAPKWNGLPADGDSGGPGYQNSVWVQNRVGWQRQLGLVIAEESKGSDGGGARLKDVRLDRGLGESPEFARHRQTFAAYGYEAIPVKGGKFDGGVTLHGQKVVLLKDDSLLDYYASHELLHVLKAINAYGVNEIIDSADIESPDFDLAVGAFFGRLMNWYMAEYPIKADRDRLFAEEFLASFMGGMNQFEGLFNYPGLRAKRAEIKAEVERKYERQGTEGKDRTRGAADGARRDGGREAPLPRQGGLQRGRDTDGELFGDVQGAGREGAADAAGNVIPPSRRFQGGNPDIRFSLADIVTEAEEAGIKVDAAESKDKISLSRIVVPEEGRGRGKGSTVMQRLVEYADSIGKMIVLSPSTDFGASSVARLKEFYKRFGFVENKGKNKDFSTRETMLRPPQSSRFSLADTRRDPERDAYLAAVEAGDMETAQRMVDEAAKKAGYNVGPVYHVTNSEFNVFSYDNFGQRDKGSLGRAFYFLADRENAERWFPGKRVISAHLKVENPQQFNPWENAASINDVKKFGGRQDGKDAVVEGSSLDWKNSAQIAVFDPSQIKSADPVVRDDAGRVIPLSERFQAGNADIRYGDIGPRPMNAATIQAGAKLLAQGVVLRNNWSGQMADRFGEGIRPYLGRIWTFVNQNRRAIMDAGNISPAQVDAFLKRMASAKGRLEAQEPARKLADQIRVAQASSKATAKEVRKEGRAETRAAVERERMKAKTQVAAAVEKVADEPPKRGGIVAGIQAAFRAGVKEGQEMGHDRAIEDVIDQGFRALVSSYTAGTPRFLKALEALGAKIELMDARMAGVAEAEQDEAIKKTLVDIFGEVRYRLIRRVTHGDRKKTVEYLKKRLQQHLAREYARNIRRIVEGTRVEEMHPDYREQFKEMMEKESELVRRLEMLRSANEKLSRLQKKKATKRELEEQAEKIREVRQFLEKHFYSRDWQKLRELHDTLSLLARSSERQQEIIDIENRVRRADAAKVAGGEVAAALPEIKRAQGANRRGFFKHQFIDRVGHAMARALIAVGGKSGTTLEKVFHSNLEDASSRAETLSANAHKKLEAARKRLGIGTYDLVKWQTTKHKFRDLEFTEAEIMELYALSQDEEAWAKVIANGFWPIQSKGVNLKYLAKGANSAETEAMAMELVGNLDQKQKDFANDMVEILTEMGEAGNETSMKLYGRELFQSPRYWHLKVDRRNQPDRVDDLLADLTKYSTGTLENLGITKRRVKHSSPILIGSAMDTFNEHVTQMADFTALTPAIVDALAVMNNDTFASEVNGRLGTEWLRRTKRMLERLSHLRDFSQDWAPLQRFFRAIERNYSVAKLWYLPSSILKNRYGGSMLAASELAKISPALAAKFLARSAMPTPVKMANQEIVAKLLENGYLYHRWNEDPAMVYAQLPRSLKEEIPASKFVQFWRQTQAFGMRPMARAEMANAVNLYKTLTANGYSSEAAVMVAEKITRRTQNPSTALEESGLFEDTKTSGLGVFFPFMGQPTVAANIWLMDAMRYMADKNPKNLRNLAASAGGLAANVALSVALAAAFRALRRGRPPEEKEEKADWTFSLLQGISEILDVFRPGAGTVADMLAGAVREGEFKMESLPVQIGSQLIRGIGDILKGTSKDESRPWLDRNDEERLERGILRVTDALGLVAGAGPISGGPLFWLRIMGGVIGEPIGDVNDPDLKKSPRESSGGRPARKRPSRSRQGDT